jgi:dynein heavy chain
LILPSSSLYDNFFNIENLKFMRWEEKVPSFEMPADRKFFSILVPTVDTVRYSWLVNQVMSLKKPALFCGESGTAKTVTCNACFKGLE